MILVEFIKNAFIYPSILKEWTNWLWYMYNWMLWLLIIWVILYVLIRFIILRNSKRKSEITKNVDENWINVSYSFFRSLWLILINKCRFFKDVIIGFLVTYFAWSIVSIFFWISAWYTTAWGKINVINDYSTNISNYSWIVGDWFFLPMQFIQEHNNELNFMLWLTAIYCLICFLLWWFFMTFSFNNKFVRNIGIFFWILGFLIIILWKLLDFYSMK